MCEMTTHAIKTGTWPKHSDGTPFPFVGWGNLLSTITNALKNNTGQEHVTVSIILQGENEDEFTFMSSIPSGASSRKAPMRMFIRAAQEQLEYMKVEED